MRLVTFEDQAKRSRIGALVAGGRVVDLRAACPLYLCEMGNQAVSRAMEQENLPTNMRALFEGGDRAIELARKALQHVLQEPRCANEPSEEPLFYRRDAVKLKAPIPYYGEFSRTP